MRDSSSSSSALSCQLTENLTFQKLAFYLLCWQNINCLKWRKTIVAIALICSLKTDLFFHFSFPFFLSVCVCFFYVHFRRRVVVFFLFLFCRMMTLDVLCVFVLFLDLIWISDVGFNIWFSALAPYFCCLGRISYSRIDGNSKGVTP